MSANWFLSRTVRRAGHMHKHVCKLVSAQRDVLPPDRIQKVQVALDDLKSSLQRNGNKTQLLEQMQVVADTANKNLKSYPFPAWRENIEVLLVAIAVAMAIRTFFIQPFKIPTGSMQPTLFGVTSNPDFSRPAMFEDSLGPKPGFEIPNPLTRFIRFWWSGISYTHVVAKSDGEYRGALPPKRFLLFNLKQTLIVGDEQYTVWFPPDNLTYRAGLENPYGRNSKVFKAGEDIIKLKSISGDHLFVDRMTYNFRRPRRGDIIVFETRGITDLQQDQFYIKRLVALGGERVQIANDRRLVINGRRLDTNTPGFDKVYSFPANRPPRESQYSGHVNDRVARDAGLGHLAPLFPDENATFTVKPDHYMVMGDNTVNSSDSRFWGDFPQQNVIGKSFVVYWPFGRQNGRASRFGWGVR
jgi:signal peptidase I